MEIDSRIKEIAPLIKQLLARSFTLTQVEVTHHMGASVVEMRKGDFCLVMVRERSQWMLQGERDELEPVDLWRAFNDPQEFGTALLRWIDGLSGR